MTFAAATFTKAYSLTVSIWKQVAASNRELRVQN